MTTKNYDYPSILKIESLENERKKVARKIVKAIVPYTVFALLIGSFLCYHLFKLVLGEYHRTQDVSFIGVGFLGSIFILGPLVFKFYTKLHSAYQKYLFGSFYATAYKKEIISKMLKQLDKNFTYHPEIGIAETDFKDSGFPLFSEVASYHSNDCITGEIGKTTFQFGEILALQNVPNDSLSQPIDLFRGFYFVIDLHKKIQSSTIVYPDLLKYFSKLLLGKYSEEINFRNQNFQRIKLEDPEFERYFEAYGTDQVESRYVLSPALMARMVDYKRQSNNDIQFSFHGTKVYCAIFHHNKKHYFKPPVFTSIIQSQSLNSYVTNLDLMLDFVNELNLNSKLN